jgi:outer membrane protein
MRKYLVRLLIQALALALFISDTQAITREQAVEYAMENAESIRIVIQEAFQTKQQGRQSVAFLKPQADLTGGYLELGTNAPDIPIPIEELEYPDRQLAAETVFSQLLYAGGRIWRSLDLEKNIYRQADQQEILGVREIVKNVKIAFDTVLFQEEMVQILTDRLEQRKEEMEDARDLWNVGMVTGLDVRQADVNVKFAQEELELGKARREQALIDFNLVMGRPGGDDYLEPQGALADESSILEPLVARLHERFRENDLLDLKFSESLAETARLEFEIAKGAYYPALEFVAGIRTEGESIDDMDESWRVGVQFEWNIFDGGLIRSNAVEAGSRFESAKQEMERTKKELSGAVKKIQVDYDSLKKRAQLQREAVDLSKENYDDARSLYRAGTITLVRLGVFNLRYSEARFNLSEIYFFQRNLAAEAEALLEKDADGTISK